MSIGENLANEHPDDGTLPDGMSRDEGENTVRHNRVAFRRESPGTRSQRCDVSKRSDVQKGPSTQAIDQPKSDVGED